MMNHGIAVNHDPLPPETPFPTFQLSFQLFIFLFYPFPVQAHTTCSIALHTGNVDDLGGGGGGGGGLGRKLQQGDRGGGTELCLLPCKEIKLLFFKIIKPYPPPPPPPPCIHPVGSS